MGKVLCGGAENLCRKIFSCDNCFLRLAAEKHWAEDLRRKFRPLFSPFKKIYTMFTFFRSLRTVGVDMRYCEEKDFVL